MAAARRPMGATARHATPIGTAGRTDAKPLGEPARLGP
jgi:hypothetical protein